MRIRATVTLDQKQIEELVYSLKNNERIHLYLDFEFNNVQNLKVEDDTASYQNPKDVWDKVKKIAEESKSYDNFVENILDWLDLGRQRDYFKASIYCAEKAQKITWDGLELIMLSERISFLNSDKKVASTKVSRKLRNTMNGTSLIKNIITYRDYEFKK